MIDALGQMWLPVVLIYLVTTAVALGLLVHRVPAEKPTSGEDGADEPDDEASS